MVEADKGEQEHLMGGLTKVGRNSSWCGQTKVGRNTAWWGQTKVGRNTS